MLPKRIKLVHYCQHIDFEAVLTEGMNSVIGSNGSGKSNFLDALALCLGLASNNVASKADKITDNITAGYESGIIMLDFEHDGGVGVVTVDLRRNYKAHGTIVADEIKRAKALVAELTATGEAVSKELLALSEKKMTESVKYSLKYTKEGQDDLVLKRKAEVVEWITTHALITPDAIFANYFPKQGDVDGVISADPAERQRVFNDKAGTAMCSYIHNKLSEENRGTVDFKEIEKQFEQAKLRLADRQAEFDTSKKSFDEVQQDIPDTTEAVQTVRQYTQASSDRDKMTSLASTLKSKQEQVAESQKACDEIIQQGKDVADKLARAKAGSEVATQALESHNKAIRSKQAYEAAQGTLAAAKAGLERIASSTPPAVCEAALTEHRDRLGKLSTEVKSLEGWLNSFRSGKCPTCHQPVSEDGHTGVELVAEKETSLAQLSAEYKTVAQAVSSETERVQAQKDAVFRHNQALAKAQGVFSSAETAAAAAVLEGKEMSDVNVELANQAIQSAKSLDNERETLLATYNSLSKQVEPVKAEIERIQQEISSLSEKLKDVPSEETFKAATQLIDAAQIGQSRYNEAKVAYEVASQSFDAAQSAFALSEEAYNKIGPQRLWSEIVTEVRAAFHQREAPAEVVEWYISKLVHQTMHYLEVFTAPFTISVSDDNALMCYFADKVQPASRLSGGQKNMLNISMRLAMVDLFPSNLNLLVLDEVEVHLDEENIEKLPVLLEKVKGLARSRNLVVLFVSHHPSLTDIADHVIGVGNV